MYVYVHSQSGPDLYTVGFYDPAGKWHPDSDHETREQAAARVAWLNGHNSPIAEVDVVFDKLPGPEGCRFIEVESPPGRSIKFGKWVERDDGYAALRFNAELPK